MTQTESAPSLLIVDDERGLRFSLGEWARDAGFRAVEASSGSEAMAALPGGVDVVLLDLKLGEEDGLQVLRRLREEEPTLPVVMLTGHGTVEHAVRATKLGAYDFIVKPPDLEHLRVVLRRALEHARLKREVEHLREATRPEEPLIGQSPGLKRVLQQLDRVAARSETATVLLLGETGSGKELMARYLHAQGTRANGPFIDVNCCNIPENLLESQLFGHEKGAFTDARQAKKGLLDLADCGTLFLDEIGEMPMQAQAKLLRVLETRTFRRVSGHVDITVDVRVVAATHRDLKRQISEGRFREDLFHRLNAVPISMPPLRERAEDIPILAAAFVELFARKQHRPPARIHPDAMRALVAYSWPGNIRELKNVIERVLLLEAEDEVLPAHLPVEILGRMAPAAGSGSAFEAFPPGVVHKLEDLERMAIEHALKVCDGNKTQAARKLGISRQTLRTKLKEYRMPDDGDDSEEE